MMTKINKKYGGTKTSTNLRMYWDAETFCIQGRYTFW